MTNELNPLGAAKLALDVYTVNEDLFSYKLFLKNKLFASGNHSTLTANVGGKFFLSASDGFGVCAMGGMFF